MDILKGAAQSVVYAFTSCVDASYSRRLRAESFESEAPFLEMRDKATVTSSSSKNVHHLLSTPMDKYSRMVQAGVPTEKVKLKMSMEGIDPQLLDHAAAQSYETSLYPMQSAHRPLQPHQSQQQFPTMSV
ncbi:hypothetical protein H257_09920 [Aphanomyces astaci]|uniref:Uncharacterized protein n=1 Tax=Aphanomyces astaci TaxID=112090 RepID=W4G8D4_APHAT|nr:hypothetical protein H257_09920 [Aphanomyces astaci]ETV75962.1 hypothetical protein H257_09920 [Aphanomyces astaci]|eukprot:XP_009834604.1 hypothetical protein H257_09920 [Aphanomyces astaci]